MSINLSGRSRAIIAETVPLIEQNRGPLQEALERYMARQGPYHPSPGRSKAVTEALADMLFSQAGQLSRKGSAAGLVAAAKFHHALALGGEHYSMFGDGLKPIMIDVLGSKATPSVIVAWIDAYWAIVRALHRHETRLAA